MNCKQLAKTIDHTNIDHQATDKDIKKTCAEAKKYGLRGVDVNPRWVELVSQELKGTDIKTVVLIDPPMGLSPHFRRIELCKQAKKDGADELDVVINVIDVKYERYDEVLADLKEICKILPTKVIIGSGYLTDEEIKKASEIVKKAGAFCVKTATEKDPLDRIELKEKARHLGIMKKAAPGLQIKASAKIQTYKDALMMITAGADIIGTSTGVEIIKGCRASLKRKEASK
ncbi:MAG: deoxyribose-phosphate aldolase [Candidatus Gribaldobacteria bacterium]|nr:deoxyribose-phosphate aldolase [Candidatus Gribaldobacteria bacterium]